ncbi:MAG: hypothetical protein AAGC49_01075 [Brevundimonas sp.]
MGLVARRRIAIGAVVAVAFALVACVATTVRPTSAAWVNPAYGSTTVASGSWGAASFGTCVVLNKNGTATGKQCTVTGLRAEPYNDGKPVGDRTANMYVNVSAPQAKSDGTEQIEVTLSLQAATGLPAYWTWSTAGVDPGNLSAYPGFACTSLPALRAYAPGWAGAGGDVYFVLFEKRAGHTGMLCT